MGKEQGYIHVYTGNGKGKTTAAIGLAIRALGAGKRVYFLQFMKDQIYSEHKILSRISSKLKLDTVGKPFFIAKEGELPEETLAAWQSKVVVFPPGEPPSEYVNLIQESMKKLQFAMRSGEYDLIVLDEINVAMSFDLVAVEEVKKLLLTKDCSVEVVLTGRNAPDAIIEIADLVTEMKEIRHYYQKGICARKGIEN